MSDETPDRDDDIVLAGEYALGLLSEDEAAAFELRLASEPELRAMHAAWAEDLAAMTEEVAPVAPPASLLPKIERRLYPDEMRRRQGLWDRFGLAGLAVAVLALGLYVGPELFDRPPAPPSDPAYTAQIAAEDGSFVVAAAYDAESDALYLDRREGAATPGRSLELWLIAGDAAPVSLGLLSDDPVTVVQVTDDLRGALEGGVLAISDEPPGGSPTGAPTGPVVAAGPITES